MRLNLIEGVNPLTISKIEVYHGYRWRIHPMLNRMRAKKYGVLGHILNFLFDQDSYFIEPCVEFFGSDMKVLKTIYFGSNRQAEDARDTYMEMLKTPWLEE